MSQRAHLDKQANGKTVSGEVPAILALYDQLVTVGSIGRALAASAENERLVCLPHGAQPDRSQNQQFMLQRWQMRLAYPSTPPHLSLLPLQ